MVKVAGYLGKSLTGVTGGKNRKVSDVATVIKIDLEKLGDKDEVKIFMWNKELIPYIDSVRLGG